MRDSSPRNWATPQKQKIRQNKSVYRVRQDGYVSLTWRQRGLVLLSGLLCALTALYVYAPNVAKTFPSMADWIFSYVFLVNDGRQVLSEIIQSWDQFLVSLDIAGTAASAKDWFVGTVQAIIEFGLGLVGARKLAPKLKTGVRH